MSTTTKSRLFIPAGPQGVQAGHVDMLSPEMRARLGIVMGIGGGAKGFNTSGDVITRAADGTDLNTIWAEFQKTIALQNSQRQALVDFLTYGVSAPVETVPQFGAGENFEKASEFGVPVAQKPAPGYFQMGFSFDWYDTATRFTWQFLAEATTQQIEAIHQNVLESDNRLVFMEVMRTLFNNVNRSATINGNAYNVYAFYNNDGTVPPPWKSNTFAGTHDHYFTSGAATVNSVDLDDSYNHLAHHGYTRAEGAEIVTMVNKQEGDIIRGFRSVANGGTALYDFIPAANTPSFLLPTTLRVADGQVQPSSTLRGLNVIGSYGEMIIIQEDYIPAGYMVSFATGGRESLTNPIGIREHANTSLRGLRLVKGRSNDYPLQDAYYQRGFGTGIRQRGAAVIQQITASGSYAIPAAYV